MAVSDVHGVVDFRRHRYVGGGLKQSAPHRAGRSRRSSLGKADLAFNLAQQQHASVRRKPPAVEGTRNFLAGNGWKFEGQKCIIINGG
jgi:hypothetical protein